MMFTAKGIIPAMATPLRHKKYQREPRPSRCSQTNFSSYGCGSERVLFGDGQVRHGLHCRSAG
jgi:hypothetical protein